MHPSLIMGSEFLTHTKSWDETATSVTSIHYIELELIMKFHWICREKTRSVSICNSGFISPKAGYQISGLVDHTFWPFDGRSNGNPPSTDTSGCASHLGTCFSVGNVWENVWRLDFPLEFFCDRRGKLHQLGASKMLDPDFPRWTVSPCLCPMAAIPRNDIGESGGNDIVTISFSTPRDGKCWHGKFLTILTYALFGEGPS